MKEKRIEKLIKGSSLKTSKGFLDDVMERIKLETSRKPIPLSQMITLIVGMLIFGSVLFVFGSKQINFSLFGFNYRTPFLSVQIVMALFFLIGIYGLFGQRRPMHVD